MAQCKDCQKFINHGKRCERCSKLNYRKKQKKFKMINCPHKDKDGCTNNEGKGFMNPQALKMHIYHKHNLSVADKLQSKGIETTTEKKEEAIMTTPNYPKSIIAKNNNIMPKTKQEKTKEEKPKEEDKPEDEDDDMFF